MVDITLLELNLEGASFEADAPNSGASPLERSSRSGGLGRFLGGGDDETDEEEGAFSTDDEGGASALPIILGLGIVVLGVFALRRLLGGEAEPIPAK